MPAPVFTELLPPTKSSRHNGILYTPDPGHAARGTLVVHTARASVTYLVTEFPTPWDGRAFHLAKVTPGTDPESDAEDVFVGRNGADRQCSCKGFAYGKGRSCKHLHAAMALIENGWV